MACGLPVVGVASGGVSESVDSSVGQLARVSTPEVMAEAIEALFERNAAEVGAAARRRAVERHAWDAVFGRLSRIYADVSGHDGFLIEAERVVTH
jgi:alpha-1,6-mannosyltransferase